MSPKAKKEKSRLQETEFVEHLQENGFAAERIRDQPGRRCEEGDEGGDVSTPLCGLDFPIECKHHKDGFQKVYAALENAPAALVKQNHKRFSVICWRLDDWLELVKRYEAARCRCAPPVGQVIKFGDAAE